MANFHFSLNPEVDIKESPTNLTTETKNMW